MNAVHTEVVPVDPLAPDAAVLARAAGLIRAGRLVAFPTETVYGLGANALDRQALERIYEAKRRPATDPIIAHIADYRHLAMLARHVPPLAYALAEAFWPGPLTLVLERADSIPETLARGLSTVAVRMPSHPVARSLIEAAATPIGAPSANRFARPSGTLAADVLEDLDGAVDLVIDAGPATSGIESTIVDLTGGRPQVLRPGGVSLEALQAIEPTMVLRERYLPEYMPSNAPGQLLRHYSPKAEVLFFSGAQEAEVLGAMARHAREQVDQGRAAGFLLAREHRAGFDELGPVIDLGAVSDLAAAARALFAGLRSLDRLGVDAVMVADPGRDGLAAALRDRLIRAADGRVIEVSGDVEG